MRGEIPWLERDRIDKPEHRPAGIGIRDHRRAPDSSSPESQGDAGRPAVSHVDAIDLGIDANLGTACGSRRGRKRRGKCAEAAADEPSPAVASAHPQQETAVLPAERGPAPCRRCRRRAMAARSGSDSNHSDTKSAADIGAQRRSR